MKPLRQITDTFVMVRPTHFGYNPQTAATNPYQNIPSQKDSSAISSLAMEEFNDMVNVLQQYGLKTLVLESPTAVTPDAIFPNNWFSHHSDHTLVLYPMLAPNRRLERQPQELMAILKKKSINSVKTIDITTWENNGLVLEGTGSLVLDRINRIAFATISPRTNNEALDRWCLKMGYNAVVFHAFDQMARPVYHTNIVMCVGDGFAVVTTEAIKDKKDRDLLEKTFMRLGAELIPISVSQMNAFCGNVLHVKTKNGNAVIMSDTAQEAFTHDQKNRLAKYGQFIVVSIPTIETVGGGSARCMLAEIFD